jgi:hypothetical protein
MKVPKLLLMAALLTSCASRAPVAAPLPELFNHDYEFFGTIEGHSVSGTIRFENQGVHPVEYMIVSESGLCRNQLHRVNDPRIHLRCGGLVMEFVRAGAVMNRSVATLAGTREVSSRECANWAVDPHTRQRTCTAWRTVTRTERVTRQGYVDIRRVGAG